MNKNYKKYIITRWIKEYDFDGLTEDFAIVGECYALERAKAYVQIEMEGFLTKTLTKNTDWGLMDVDWKYRPGYVGSDPNKLNTVIFSKAEKVGDGSGYNSLYVYLDVIEVLSTTSVDDQLFNPKSCGFEVQYFFDGLMKNK